MKRRDFLKAAALAAGAAAGGCATAAATAAKTALKPITVADTGCEFEREPLLRPFGFKGGYLTNVWQSAAMIRSTSGKRAIGLCTQSVLWSDASVFAANSESGGNALMYAMTAYALKALKGRTFTDPVALNDALFAEVYEYGKAVTGNRKLRQTFAPGDYDVREGDVLVVDEVEYPIRSVADWAWAGCGSYLQIVVEELKAP